MGIWTNVTGYHTSKRASFRKIVKEVLDLYGQELVCYDFSNNKINFRFEADGAFANECIKKMIDRFLEYDTFASVVLDVELNYWEIGKDAKQK